MSFQHEGRTDEGFSERGVIASNLGIANFAVSISTDWEAAGNLVEPVSVMGIIMGRWSFKN